MAVYIQNNANKIKRQKHNTIKHNPDRYYLKIARRPLTGREPCWWLVPILNELTNKNKGWNPVKNCFFHETQPRLNFDWSLTYTLQTKGVLQWYMANNLGQPSHWMDCLLLNLNHWSSKTQLRQSSSLSGKVSYDVILPFSPFFVGHFSPYFL